MLAYMIFKNNNSWHLFQLLKDTGGVDGSNACTDISGSCLDYIENKCIAGYLIGKCPGPSNIRCCQKCDATCNLTLTIYKLMNEHLKSKL